MIYHEHEKKKKKKDQHDYTYIVRVGVNCLKKRRSNVNVPLLKTINKRKGKRSNTDAPPSKTINKRKEVQEKEFQLKMNSLREAMKQISDTCQLLSKKKMDSD